MLKLNWAQICDFCDGGFRVSIARTADKLPFPRRKEAVYVTSLWNWDSIIHRIKFTKKVKSKFTGRKSPNLTGRKSPNLPGGKSPNLPEGKIQI